MNADDKNSCVCGSAPKLIFSCSGAADVGEIADHAARRLTKEGVGKMYCLAGVGGRISGIMMNVQAAGGILAIDGCKLGCARRTLEEGGFKDFIHLQLGDAGLEKGSSPATDDRVAAVVGMAKALLNS